MRKPEIPDPSAPSFGARVRELLQVITGRRANTRIDLLPENATTAEVAAKINELLRLLQD